jgi:hypothetical protein
MLKKIAGSVLAGHCRLTISAAFTYVPGLIRHGVNLRGSTYEVTYASPPRSLRSRRTVFLNILEPVSFNYL